MFEVKTEVDIADGKPYMRVVARIDGKMVHANEFNPANAGRRRSAAEALAEAAGDPARADEFDKEFLKALDDAMRTPPAEAVDVSKIVRPDLFITPHVVGLSIPQAVIVDGEPGGQWKLHLAWNDGRREVCDLPRCLDLPDGTKLWIHPMPANPSANRISGWSSPARRAWQYGSASPDPAAVFQKLCAAINQFIELPPDQAPGTIATLALWVMLTYVYPAWDAVPYLYVGGPLGSGKTRVFEVLSRLVYRPLGSSNLSAPFLFRTLHDRGGVLLLDEAESLKESGNDANEIRSILLAGYKRGGKATRLEASGDTFVPVEFDCYGPKAIACIKGVPPALASRCIPVTMFRAAPGSEKPKRRIDANPLVWSDLRDDLHALALGSMGHAALALATRRDVCKLSGRSYELWQPLMGLAAWLEQHGAEGLLRMVQDHARLVMELASDDAMPDADETLLRVLAEGVADCQTMTPALVLTKAQGIEPETFRRWQARTVSVHLSRYGIRAVKSNGVRSYRDLTLDDMRKIQRHYNIDLGIADVQPPVDTRPDSSDPSDPSDPSDLDPSASH